MSDQSKRITRGEPHLGPGGYRLECAAGYYMTREQLAIMDAAQDRVLASFYAVGDCYEREGHPCAFDTLAACHISWSAHKSIDPGAEHYIDHGGEG